ncbi:hypothetical protein ACIPUB_01380 [Paeniglutamicibacter sp. ORCA_105]|uniref:hypothetical protein n=1 Tax=Paeniglutamicibacter sp. ORCA_105 TaxID=3377336 RepID=UPI003895D2F3
MHIENHRHDQRHTHGLIPLKGIAPARVRESPGTLRHSAGPWAADSRAEQRFRSPR